jgi:hypothetical protein
MQVKITCLRGKGLNYQVEIDGKMILENVRHPLPMLAGRLIAKGHDRSTVIDFQVNEGAVMRSAPLSELTELPRPRLELHRPFQTARRAA